MAICTSKDPFKDFSVYSTQSYPSKLFVEVTTRCNLKCTMCVKQTPRGTIQEGHLSSDLFKKLIPAFPFINALILNGIGEPLLHPNLEEFIKIAKEHMPETAWVGFQSNGMLLTESRALSLLDAGLDRICLSIDSVSGEKLSKIREGAEVSEIEKAFTALNNAKLLRKNKNLQIGIEFVLMKDNLLELPETVKWAARHGAEFVIVTQLLPYDKNTAKQAVYDTNTSEAISIFKKWKELAEKEGINILEYYDVFMKFFKNDYEERLCYFVEQMKAEARKKNTTLHLERLFSRDEQWFTKVEEIFDQTREIAQLYGLEIILPELAPKNNRKCEFVEAMSAFISWDGSVHPCYFLWHRYVCYIGGLEKFVKPWSFGNLKDNDILEIWNREDFRAFRQNVLQYDFPFCFDCSFALCDYAQMEEFIQDCYTIKVPCGSCLWCTGLFHCLQ
ncbi:MAG: radical SAM/SPASM family putative metalloenzyme maturase [Nitrospirae bacterium]|nr:radical SAM/SPASM family putative metalloenzyme maturase [Nitrospirota bacterium]